MSGFGFPKQSKSQEIGRKGEAFFEEFVAESLGWIYRPVHNESDFGIDGYVDVVIDGSVTGQSIAVQIKCSGRFSSKNYNKRIRYNGQSKHLNYYLNHSSPIVLIAISEDLHEAYWLEFSIDLTSESSRGWWIEIPKRNKLDSSVGVNWIEIVGPATDFTEAIENEWLLNSVTDECDLKAFTIPKEEVVSGSYDYIRSVVARLSRTHECLVANRGMLEIFFPEYDCDSREIYEIPEIRSWFKGSLDVGIPWLYFLNSSGAAIGLKLLFFCCCNVKFVEAVNGKHLLLTEPHDRSEWLMKNFHNLNQFTERHEIPVEVNKACCDATMSVILSE